jgi:hypothetical protein
MRSYAFSLFFAAFLAPFTLAAQPVIRDSTIIVAPAKTSIYVGHLAVLPGPFTWNGTGFEANLTVTLEPYGFHDEAKVHIQVGDDELERLQRGETIDFKGRVVRENGQTRRLTGRAVPSGPTAGKLDIRVFLSSQITVSFATTYQVVPPVAK